MAQSVSLKCLSAVAHHDFRRSKEQAKHLVNPMSAPKLKDPCRAKNIFKEESPDPFSRKCLCTPEPFALQSLFRAQIPQCLLLSDQRGWVWSGNDLTLQKPSFLLQFQWKERFLADDRALYMYVAASKASGIDHGKRQRVAECWGPGLGGGGLGFRVGWGGLTTSWLSGTQSGNPSSLKWWAIRFVPGSKLCARQYPHITFMLPSSWYLLPGDCSRLAA